MKIAFYDSSLTEAQWAFLKPMFPKPSQRGRPPTDRRVIIDAIFYVVIRQNLFFAFIYNALGVPVAAGALYPFFRLLLSPIIASAAMSFSSVSVIANALRLKIVRLSQRE